MWQSRFAGCGGPRESRLLSWHAISMEGGAQDTSLPKVTGAQVRQRLEQEFTNDSRLVGTVDFLGKGVLRSSDEYLGG